MAGCKHKDGCLIIYCMHAMFVCYLRLIHLTTVVVVHKCNVVAMYVPRSV